MKYFAYGSNLNMAQMAARCKDSKPLSIAVLHGYHLKYRRGFATIEYGTEHDKVFGGIYQVSNNDVAELDIYEGFPTMYYRDIVQVDVQEPRFETALTYMMHKCFDETVPRDGYYEIIEQGYLDWGLPLGSLENTVQ